MKFIHSKRKGFLAPQKGVDPDFADVLLADEEDLEALGLLPLDSAWPSGVGFADGEAEIALAGSSFNKKTPGMEPVV